MSELDLAAWWGVWTSTEVPVLPSTGVEAAYRQAAWSVVLGWLGTRCLGWKSGLVAALWAWVPGGWGVSYWLGLAFQSPSILSVMWCAGLIGGRWRREGPAVRLPNWVLAWIMVLGWLLMADLLAWLPVSLYAWGFSSVAVGLVALLSCAPWAVSMLRRGRQFAPGWGGLALPLSLAVFVAWRLPTGNVWDAVLDPWLWLACHWVAWRRFRSPAHG